MVRVFAYGSNLCVERLRARTPSAQVLAVGTLSHHSLRWHKRSQDGSGKCDAFETGLSHDLVWGVVYELTRPDKLILDGFEGLGDDYFEKKVGVWTRDRGEVEAMVYVANSRQLDAAMRPYSWYKGYVTTGAAQHDFPAEYRALLDAVDAQKDENKERHARERAVLDLALRQSRDG